MFNYPKEQLWELYNALPKDLQTALFSADNAEKVYNICAKNGTEKSEQISKIAEIIGYVLCGLILPGDLENTIVQEVKIDQNNAKQIAWEINRFIFLPVKDSLESLYEIKITPKGTTQTEEGAQEEPREKETAKTTQAKTAKQKAKDKYREAVEEKDIETRK